MVRFFSVRYVVIGIPTTKMVMVAWRGAGATSRRDVVHVFRMQAYMRITICPHDLDVYMCVGGLNPLLWQC